MDKRSKEALRRYKKSRQQSSSDSSSSSDSDSSGSSYSSSDSERHRRKKARQATGGASRRSSSSSTEERRKREKREHCQKKLEAKRIHLKRKLKEAKLKKRAAAAAAALSGHIGHRSLSPTTQAKLKKLAERKHQRAASKERREREKHRVAIAREREREREHHRTGSRSPTKITKIRIHQDVKRQKSPPRMHHTMMSREKIIIQTRTRERTPSPTVERRHEHKIRHEELVRERERRDRERDRAEREAARDKERAEALARCQERQRERERLAREKLRREEEEKKYGGIGSERGERLLPRPAERELAIAASRGYNSRERSLEAIERTRHMSKHDLDVYEREREYMEAERRNLINREDIRRDREYMPTRRRDLSPVGEHYSARLRDPHDVYPDENRERAYNRAYIEDGHHGREREAPWTREIRERELHDIRDVREQRDTRDPRDFRDMDSELIYPDERERLIRNRERVREEWKGDWDISREQEWNDTPPITGRGGFIGGPKRNTTLIGGAPNPGPSKIPPREQRAPSEPDWDAVEVQKSTGTNINKIEPQLIRDGSNFGIGSGQRDTWGANDHHDMPPQREKPIPPPRTEGGDRRWQNDWREEEDAMQRVASVNSGSNIPPSMHHHRSERGGRNFRRGVGAGGPEHGDRNGQGLRTHPPPLMTLPVQPPATGFLGGNPRFPNKSKMTYTNPNIIKKQHAAMAAAKAAQASAVAAASTAVAAAKAAAQSAANATTNPSILGQASNLIRQQHETFINDDKPEAGEILHDADSNKNLDSGATNKKVDNFLMLGNPAVGDNRAAGELSEISDSDDDILNKGDKKSRTETDEDSTVKVDGISEQEDLTRSIDDAGIVDEKNEDDEMLDFEEISDGELEEDSRNKGVGDALGVDWASLIAETKLQAENAVPGANEQPTTAKQKWQPHRIILDMGISLCMAGEDYAKKLLSESRQKLDEELKEISQKVTLEGNTVSVKKENDESKSNNLDHVMDTKENVDVKIEPVNDKPVDEMDDDVSFNLDSLQPLACLQVGERKQRLERQMLISNACGTHSRALSARQDLKLRRQICNLPARDYDLSKPPPISAKIKSLALAAFQRTLEVK
ncbi:fl(2)d-associated complex component [Bactrocera dorsalis]|uniref:Fl(2)d-associated complex component n=1 Tax=Bactrocera dorsalis TaxID=27457 RepID=A0A6I9VLU6_BACDO|nr:fl(2)d-associated complex component [Bactrocera dorsalis]